MDEKTGQALGFAEIRNMLIDRCWSQVGRELIVKQRVLTSVAALRRRLRKVAAFTDLLKNKPLSGFRFVDLPFMNALPKSGGCLAAEELAHLSLFIKSSQKLALLLNKAPIDHADHRRVLTELSARLPDLTDLAERIDKVVDADGELRPDHPVLKSAWTAIRKARQAVATLSESYLKNNKDIWQADRPTQRDGRTVLPLKAGSRGQIQGLIHGQSASQATCFIEPADLIEKNNRLTLAENDLRHQSRRLLRELTGSVVQSSQECSRMVREVAFLDSLAARACLGLLWQGIVPETQEEGLRLNKARHPLLGSAAVPLDLCVAPNTTTLVVSGPNAGGKTVVLKTTALMAMLHQFGLPLPAAPGTSLPVFSQIFMHIGDQQSLADGLSTFSGQVKRLRSFLKSVDQRTMVLLDEFGAATDPEEGAALALAVLDFLAQKKALTLAAGHAHALKVYGDSRPGAANAAVCLDKKSGLPTYTLIAGQSGASQALRAAEKAGLLPEIIKKARLYLENRQTDTAAILTELSQRRVDLEKKAADLQNQKEELGRQQRDIDRQKQDLRYREAVLKNNQAGQFNQLVAASRKQIENLVAELKSQPLTRQTTGKARRQIDQLSEQAANLDKKAQVAAQEAEPLKKDSDRKPVTLAPGLMVKVAPHNQTGRLIEIDKKGNWLVAVGSVRLKAKSRDLVALDEKRIGQKTANKIAVQVQASQLHPPPLELDLRGKRLSEAIEALSSHIDQALVAGLGFFSVIHGMGEGVLAKGIHAYLADCQAVKSRRFAHPENGGFGKTEVVLRG